MIELLLASASPARAATLRGAGIEPIVRVSQVDEPALLARAMVPRPLPPADQVQVLARAKAEDVAAGPDADGRLVLGCDSMFELGGRVYGKPRDAAEATARIAAMSGRTGILHTGHWLIDRRSEPAQSAPAVGAPSATEVHMGTMTAAEIDAYVATGEPLAVAGSFTIDGLGGPFIDGVTGDPHGVVGLSLPLLRALLIRLGLSITDLWP